MLLYFYRSLQVPVLNQALKKLTVTYYPQNGEEPYRTVTTEGSSKKTYLNDNCKTAQSYENDSNLNRIDDDAPKINQEYVNAPNIIKNHEGVPILTNNYATAPKDKNCETATILNKSYETAPNDKNYQSVPNLDYIQAPEFNSKFYRGDVPLKVVHESVFKLVQSSPNGVWSSRYSGDLNIRHLNK